MDDAECVEPFDERHANFSHSTPIEHDFRACIRALYALVAQKRLAFE